MESEDTDALKDTEALSAGIHQWVDSERSSVVFLGVKTQFRGPL